ncbi:MULTISPECIES: P27 family phage terminase small subunit [Enterococcus]|uniref:Terminase n=2 Tax=Enterococcus TaxID=1350 RepID=A0A1E5GU29_9ENTE|nr:MULTISPECIES: P27 family phage terminase small subunit [Enterococcus]OEG16167.1 hypothetical protein BCR25_18400 [Enterococcus termitis]OJG96813.1 hypothetical protein RV18_GL001859 [Enterococcus termitis]GGC88125.1 hypothetical protein GCM10011573_17150 [Enterococcus wangshanyuanii]
MVKNVPKEETIKRDTIKQMKSLGVYKIEYNRLISIYAGLVHQYYFQLREFEKDGSRTFVISGTNSVKKSPILASLESLRKDIVLYSDRLCLNAKAAENRKTSGEDDGDNPLANFLEKMGG